MDFGKVLTDVERGIYLEDWSISSDELGVGEKWSIEKHRLHGGVSDGVDTITIDNGKLSFIVVPTRGMGIWKGTYKGISLGWKSPVKDLVNPSCMDLEDRGGLGWLDGFNEWIVRCGLSYFGAPGKDIIKDNSGRDKEITLSLHGKIANIPASVVKVRIGLEPPFEIGVEGIVYERTMFGSNLKLSTSITTTPGSNSLKIADATENLRSVPDEMQMLYHCNYGAPFLKEGTRLVAPIRRIAPNNEISAKGINKFDEFGFPEAGFVEQVYFMELISDRNGHTRTMLVNKDETEAVSVSFSLKELPFFTLWKNTSALDDGYVTGLEPGTSFPNPRRFEREQGRVLKLRPKQKYFTQIVLSVYSDKGEVQKTFAEIEKIRGKTKTVVHKEPI